MLHPLMSYAGWPVPLSFVTVLQAVIGRHLLSGSARAIWRRAAAVVMAITAWGIHHGAMAAVTIAPDAVQTGVTDPPNRLILPIALSIILCLILALATLWLFSERRLKRLSEREAGNLAATQPQAASESLLRDFVEVASDWIWETDAALNLTFVSKRFGDTSGIPWAHVHGRAFGDLVALGFDPAGMAELMTTMRASDSFQGVVHAVALASGTVRFWRLSGRPYVDAVSGLFGGYRGSGTDVTARMEREAVLTAALLRAEEAEREVRRARERLVDAIEAISEGFVLHDAEDRLVLCNARYGEMYGLPPEAMTPGARFEDTIRASTIRDVSTLSPQQADANVVARLTRHRASGGNREEQCLADGRWLQVEERRTSDGGTVGIRVDVTDARLREAAEREHDRAIGELKAARLIQTNLLPSARLLSEITAASGLNIASRSASSSELGGDLWGISSLGDRRIGVYTVDFAGHGTPAALNTFRLHTLIHELRHESLDPAGFLVALNLRLSDLLPPGTFATMFYGIVDSGLNRISYASAGSPPPILRCGKDAPLMSLDSCGIPLGITAGADYVCSTAAFEPGAMLVLYSDMLTDCIDEHGERAGEAGAFQRVQDCAVAPTAEALVDAVCAPFLNEQTIPLSDDLTVVCIMRD